MGKNLQKIQHVWYMKSVHPDAELRNVATECDEEYSSFATELIYHENSMTELL